jgi:hypothetical protein
MPFTGNHACLANTVALAVNAFRPFNFAFLNRAATRKAYPVSCIAQPDAKRGFAAL